MPDVMTPEQRSRCMSRIKSRDTGPELKLRHALWAAGLRFRLALKLPGRPDIVFTRARLTVFVDGCFWHGCPEHGTKPKSNAAYWNPKIEGNIDRDRRNTALLQAAGWRVIRIWEHDVERDLSGAAARVIGTYRSELSKRGIPNKPSMSTA